MLKILLIVVIMLSCPTTVIADKPLIVGNFSGETLNGLLSEHWQVLEFDGINNHTDYTHIIDNNVGVIQAKSIASSSGLVRKISINPEQLPIISWHWKIQNIIQNADLSRKKGDDAPARVYVTFAYDSNKVGWFEKFKFEAIKLFYGEYPPIGALTYVWASQTPKGTFMDNPYTARVKVIVLESGDKNKGKWLSETRNIHADYRKAFASDEVPMISGVAIMTDTDNTGKQATSWYGDIIFSE